ncbi:MAG: cysteine--tRNA ligase [Gammaproteobacteria bacterium]|nr:cysteine--tRNA ligase [Gammaproteobacteria bacterium]
MPLPELYIYNSLTRQKTPFEPIEAGKVGMYVCGVTVYDDAHLGHARMLVVFDMVVRYLRARGLEVSYVRNITDIDDKIIRRATENGEDWQALVERYVERVAADEEALGLIRPDVEPRATQNLDAIVAMIERLIEKKHAYAAGNGDVYYAVATFPDYGALAGQRPEDLRSGARIEPDEAKRDALDFALWKAEKPGEPAWDAPWGRGRPGWHIECSAMSIANLGEHFDIHGGGLDLKFPHHQNEIAQSEGMTGERFANVWMHNGFVEVGEEKMAKSLGNFTTIRDLLERWPGETLRYFILTSHYRSPLSYTEARIEEAHAALSRLYLALRGFPAPVRALRSEAKSKGDAGGDCVKRFHRAMSDDFNTPEALAALHALAREVNRRREAGEGAETPAAELRSLAEPLGLLQTDADEFLRRGQGAGNLTDNEIERLIKERRAARFERSFQRADDIRNQLTEAGIVLEDTADGTLWRRG